MFKDLDQYRVIVVSGPQRSGTTLCAAAIAHDTGYRLMREDHFRNVYRFWRQLVDEQQGVVVQCPVMSLHLHDIGEQDDVLVVWMLRETLDIIASQNRIGWTEQWEPTELARYNKAPDEGPICEVKLRYWRDEQRDQIKHWREVAYPTLVRHPLWIDEETRRDPAVAWTSRQVDLENSW